MNDFAAKKKADDNVRLLKRLMNWRTSKLCTFEVEQQLKKRNVDKPKGKATKPVLCELLRERLEKELLDMKKPTELGKIHHEYIQILKRLPGNQDGYNKKAMVHKLKSRGVKYKSKDTKKDLIQKLIVFLEQEKQRLVDMEVAQMNSCHNNKQPPAPKSSNASSSHLSISSSQYAMTKTSPVYATATGKENQSNAASYYGASALSQRPMSSTKPAACTTFPQQSSVVTTVSSLTKQQKQAIEAKRLAALRRKAALTPVPVTPSPTSLTIEQRKRLQANRARALTLRAAAMAEQP